MKISISVILHWLGLLLSFATSVAVVVAGGNDVKLAGYATGFLTLAAAIKPLIDAQENKATLASSIAAIVPVVKAATVGNINQAQAVQIASEAAKVAVGLEKTPHALSTHSDR